MTQQLPQIALNWLDDLDREGKSQATISAYRYGIQHFVNWYEWLYKDVFDPAVIMPRDIRDWQAAQQQQEKAAPATINQRVIAVKGFFKWVQQRHPSTPNPGETITTLRLPQQGIKSLNEVSLRRLLRAARISRRDYAILEVLVGTGIRVGELLQLQLVDIPLHPRSGQLIVRYGKGGTYREIPLTRDVRQALQGYLDHDHPHMQDPQQPLWWGRAGAISHRSSITRLLDKYALRAGLPPVTPHMLRHTFATRYLKANPDDLRGLACLLGHSSLDTVMIYTQPDLHDLETRLERMDHPAHSRIDV